MEDALADYSKVYPYVKDYVINMVDRRFTFDEAFDEELNRVPDWIANCTPVLGIGNPTMNPYQGLIGLNNRMSDEPFQAVHVYRKPKLTVSHTGDWDVQACFKHKVIALEEDDDISNETIYDVPTITSEDTVFFQLLQGLFLQGIGRSRRSFTLNDLPINMDADTLASEGESIEEKARENFQNIQKIHTLIR